MVQAHPKGEARKRRNVNGHGSENLTPRHYPATLQDLLKDYRCAPLTLRQTGRQASPDAAAPKIL
jgi:hypothetical protein